MGRAQALRALHSTRLEFFLTQAIDTTVRGFVYEARGTTTPPAVLVDGERIARSLAARNAIPARFLVADPHELTAWLEDARGAVASLLAGE